VLTMQNMPGPCRAARALLAVWGVVRCVGGCREGARREAPWDRQGDEVKDSVADRSRGGAGRVQQGRARSGAA
jgi:hypothetical protein